MIVKFNKFERVAGVFVLTAILGSVAATVGIAIKKGWFERKITYITLLESADGLHAGTKVQVAGLRAGAVRDVDLISANEVRVTFFVFEKFQRRIRKDSELMVIRPFIIGEKVLEISVGNDEQDMLSNGDTITSMPSMDIMDLVSGKKLAPVFGALEGVLDNLKVLMGAFADTKRTQAFVDLFDRMNPLILNLNKMTVQMTKMTWYLNEIIPDMVAEAPHMGKDMKKLVANLNILTQELAPAVQEVGPKLPRASLRALEALDEAVVILKAMQRTFILSGKVEDVREEEQKRENKNNRQPANQ